MTKRIKRLLLAIAALLYIGYLFFCDFVKSKRTVRYNDGAELEEWMEGVVKE